MKIIFIIINLHFIPYSSRNISYDKSKFNKKEMSVIKNLVFKFFYRNCCDTRNFICSQTKKCVPSVSILSAGL
jgi:hypothetical protein